jgi:hypothetical protein
MLRPYILLSVLLTGGCTAIACQRRTKTAHSWRLKIAHIS